MAGHSPEIRKAWRRQVPQAERVRNAVAVFYAILLVIGLCLPLYALNFALKTPAREALAAFAAAGASLALLGLTVAYGVVFARRGLNFAMPVLYVVGYGLTAALVAAAFMLAKTNVYVFVGLNALASFVPLGVGAYGYRLNARTFQPTLFHPPARTVKPWW